MSTDDVEADEVAAAPASDLAALEELLVDMKDTSELMVDLAYSAILYDSHDIAEEVLLLEDETDIMLRDLERASLQAHKGGECTTDRALAVLRLGRAIEEIADAARELADVVLRDVPMHPVVAESIHESDATIVRVRVREAGSLAGKSIGAVHLATETGMWVVAIRRGRRWIYGPGKHTRLAEGDVLYARGPIEGAEPLRELAGEPEPRQEE